MTRDRKSSGLAKNPELMADDGNTGPSAARDSKRAHTVVDALFLHFKQWYPEVIKDASSIQEMRSACAGEREK